MKCAFHISEIYVDVWMYEVHFRQTAPSKGTSLSVVILKEDI